MKDRSLIYRLNISHKIYSYLRVQTLNLLHFDLVLTLPFERFVELFTASLLTLHILVRPDFHLLALGWGLCESGTCA